MTPPMFSVPAQAVGAGSVTLDGPEGHHAADVRRLKVGESLWLTNGVGARGEGVVTAARRGALDVEVSRWSEDVRPAPLLVVAQALAKGGRDEDAIEAMTEVGVDGVVGWQASRSIAKWTDRTGAKWTSTVEAAARQARRTWWPTVNGPETTANLALRVAAFDVALLLHEAATEPIAGVDLSASSGVLVVVGPEGGIADEELAALVAAGGRPVRLGETVLRSSTAGVAALAVIAARTRWS